MLRRVRPTTPMGWGILASYLIAFLLMVWAVVVVDWWSTAVSLYDPDDTGGLVRGRITREGTTLLSGYPVETILLLILLPFGAVMAELNRAGATISGLAGIVITVVATQLDSPVPGLVATNAWIPAAVAWFIYFGALLARVSTRGPRLEFDERPDSSDG
ncbi:MAG: hypothetical protein JHC95_17820 [Solirubrobacteraceae bacterium]|nr:hypothetical protein [Solirubrobacteraceae bacterium]